MLQEVDHRAVVAIIPHAEIHPVAGGLVFSDDDLVAVRVTHDGGVARARAGIQRIPARGRELGEVYSSFEVFKFGIRHQRHPINYHIQFVT